MEELKELYESKKYAALDRACRKAEAGDSQDFEVYFVPCLQDCGQK